MTDNEKLFKEADTEANLGVIIGIIGIIFLIVIYLTLQFELWKTTM